MCDRKEFFPPRGTGAVNSGAGVGTWGAGTTVRYRGECQICTYQKTKVHHLLFSSAEGLILFPQLPVYHMQLTRSASTS